VWKIRYALTDVSAAEQRAVNIAFTEQDNEKFGNIFGEVEHLLRHWHCKQTLDRQLHGDILADANQHLKAALFSRRSEAGCDESIQAALDSVPDSTVIMRGSGKNKSYGTQKSIFATNGRPIRRCGLIITASTSIN
jgi:hypothetical protein